MPKKNTEEVTFETSFRRLEEILGKLENDIDDTSLDEVMDYYKEGLVLLKYCRTKLNETELQIEKIKAESRN